MTYTNRPTQVSTILKAISTSDEIQVSAPLETYIADLEGKQPNRPNHIVAILEQIELQYDADKRAILETYLTELEAHQLPWLPRKVQQAESSYWRSVRREKERKAHALRKQNSY